MSAFDQVEAGLTFSLTIRQGEVFSVVLFSDDNFMQYLQVEQTGRNISLGFLPGYAYDDKVSPYVPNLPCQRWSGLHYLATVMPPCWISNLRETSRWSSLDPVLWAGT